MEPETLLWTRRLLGLSLVLQTCELLWVRRAFSEDGVFAWSSVRRDLVRVSGRPRLLDALLSYRGFVCLLVLQLFLALLLPWSDQVAGLLVFSALLIEVRFRGSYNGGSDAMTMVVLNGLLVAQLGWPRIGFGYITAQLVLSYFLAGLSKLGSTSWRDGSALSRLVSMRKYVVPQLAQRLLSNTALSRLGSWLVLGFECSFPLTLLLGREVALGYLTVSLCFHLAIAYTLGLNRFLWAWLAAYPALLYWL